MAVVPFVNGRIYVAGVNLSGRANSGMLNITAAELDASSISDAWDMWVMGRKGCDLQANGFWEAGAGLPDDLYALLGVAGQTVTVLPDGADGGIGYSVRAVPVHYIQAAPAGGLITFDVAASGDLARAIRGTTMHDDSTARTATGVGVARQLGAIGAGQTLYASVHVIGASGTTPTLDLSVLSATTGAMTSPTTLLSIPTATAIGGGWGSVVGPVTDTWWQVKYTIGGTTPSFKFVVVLAIH